VDLLKLADKFEIRIIICYYPTRYLRNTESIYLNLIRPLLKLLLVRWL